MFFQRELKRAKSFRPIQARVYTIIRRGMSKNPITKTEKSSGELDRQLRNPPIFNVRGQSIEWGITGGSRLYSYMAWRREKYGKGRGVQIFLYSRQIQTDLVKLITSYILKGR